MWDIFVKKQLNEDFSIKGYVKFQLFNNTEIEQIKQYYIDNIASIQLSKSKHSFHATSCTSDTTLIKQVDDYLKPLFIKALEPHVVNCNYIITNFLVKESVKSSVVTPHLDLSFVDEPENVSFNVWVCLDDCNKKSGNMQIIEGSHKFFNSIRVSPSQPKYFDKYQNELKRYFQNIPTKAGECIVFHHNLIHASSENSIGRPRISCIISGYNKNANLYHYYYDESNPGKAEKYEIVPLSLLELIFDQRPPHSNLIDTIDYNQNMMNYKELRRKIITTKGGLLNYLLFLTKNKIGII